MKLHLLLAAALASSVLTMGCEGDMPLRMVQRDVDATKRDADLKSQSARVAQERQGFLQSQAALTAKLDELTTGVRLAQGQSEEIGHGIADANRSSHRASQGSAQGRRSPHFA